MIQDSKEKKLFVYDSDCGLCKMFVKWTKKFPSLIKKIQFMPFHIFNAEHSKIYDLESDEQLKNSLLIYTNREESGQINTKIYRGAASINGILRSVDESKLIKFLGYLYLIPGIKFIQDRIYTLIAKYPLQ